MYFTLVQGVAIPGVRGLPRPSLPAAKLRRKLRARPPPPPFKSPSAGRGGERGRSSAAPQNGHRRFPVTWVAASVPGPPWRLTGAVDRRHRVTDGRGRMRGGERSAGRAPFPSTPPHRFPGEPAALRAAARRRVVRPRPPALTYVRASGAGGTDTRPGGGQPPSNSPLSSQRSD